MDVSRGRSWLLWRDKFFCSSYIHSHTHVQYNRMNRWRHPSRKISALYSYFDSTLPGATSNTHTTKCRVMFKWMLFNSYIESEKMEGDSNNKLFMLAWHTHKIDESYIHWNFKWAFIRNIDTRLMKFIVVSLETKPTRVCINLKESKRVIWINNNSISIWKG